MAPRKKLKTLKQNSLPILHSDTKNILIGIIFIVISLLAFFSTQVPESGKMPVMGEYVRIAGLFLFWEYFRLIFSPLLLALGIMLAIRKAEWNILKAFGIFGFFVAFTSLIWWFYVESSPNMFFNIYTPLKEMLGTEMAFLLLLSLFLLSLYLIFWFSYTKILKNVGSHTKTVISQMRMPEIEVTEYSEKPIKKESKTKVATINAELQDLQQKKEKQQEEGESSPLGAKIISGIFKNSQNNTENNEKASEKKAEKMIQTIRSEKKIPLQDASGKIVSKPRTDKEVPQKTTKPLSGWTFPSVQLLAKPKKSHPISPEEIREKALIIQKTLLQFGIEVEMEKECVWPTVIQYRLRPAEGVKVAKIEALNKDLALALSAKSIRIQAPIPGMNLVGIEVPNDKRDIISIREVIESEAFSKNSKKLSVALGKDINGDYIVWDLAKMPHLLIAGQTGSGKSVGMNGIILSLLYKNSPADLQMIMVDPKQVELWMYDGIPHLLTPVITSPDKALNSLKWSVAEMERRFGIFREKRVKNLDEFNDRAEKSEKMPAIVFIIDELADLMMSGNKKEVEHNIARIAQKGRAAGMHIIIATQRPSVNVITGIIKANVPTRIAFTVASQIDSRTILDQMGAESLLGRGDMLYFPTGAMWPTRVQGMLVETDEIDNVVREIRLTIMDEDWSPNIPDTENIVREWPSNKSGSIIDGQEFDESEEVINAAIELVQSAGKCSTSMLQRHLKLGYGRAARLVDILEEMGIVGPADGSRPREVLQ